MSSYYDAIVIGSGHNGLVAAGYLSKSGLRVLVIERREVVGGACVTEELFPGYRFSTCSYGIHALMTKVVKDLDLKKFGYEVFIRDPSHFSPFADGEYIIWWKDNKKTIEEIERLSEHDARMYPKWTDFIQRTSSVISSFFLSHAPTQSELLTKAKQTGDEEIVEKVLTSSIRDLAEEYFQNDNLKRHVCSGGQDQGPEDPGSAYWMAHFPLDFGEGVSTEPIGIVKGGQGAITEAMKQSLLSLGGKVITGTEVNNLLIKDGKATGVRLFDGREFNSRIVISNADPKRTFLNVVGEENLDQEFVRKIRNLKTISTSMKLHLALKKLPDFSEYLGNTIDPHILAEVTIGPPNADLLQKSWEDAKNGMIPRDHLIWIQIATVYDKSMCPEGNHSMTVWSQFFPRNLKEGSWEDFRTKTAESLIDTISNFAPNMKEIITQWSASTPFDLEQKIGFTDGNIRHLDMIPGQIMSERLHYRTPIKGLYLCGAGTYPGGEVTGAPGHNSSQIILKDMKEGMV